jgi:putative transposase
MPATPPTTPQAPARVHDDGWRLPDELWERFEPLLPPRKPHPLGRHNPRVPDRRAMDAICFVLRTGCPWGALDATAASAPIVRPTAVCRHGRRPASSRPCRSRASRPLTPSKALLGPGWPWTGR